MAVLQEIAKCTKAVMAVAKDMEHKYGEIANVFPYYRREVGKNIEGKAVELIALGQQIKKLAKEFAKS